MELVDFDEEVLGVGLVLGSEVVELLLFEGGEGGELGLERGFSPEEISDFG